MQRVAGHKSRFWKATMATALAASVTGGITIGASSAEHRGEGSPLIEFQAVDSARLDALGVRLKATAAIPTLSAGDAGQAASRALGGAAVREAHFAQCDVNNIQPERFQRAARLEDRIRNVLDRSDRSSDGRVAAHRKRCVTSRPAFGS